MTPSRFLIGTTVAAMVAAVGLLGGVFADRGPAESHAAPPPLAARGALEGDTAFASGSTAALVHRYEAAIAAGANSPRIYVKLGLAYQQRARETANPSYYGLSERALRRAAAIDPQDALALSGLASLALSRHRFRAALALGERARRLAPDTARTYGVIGDAQLELGRYRLAFASFDRMSALKPGLASYARVAYARELLGDVRGAVAALRLALGPALGQPEATAWTHNELGKLLWSTGRHARAAREFRLALAASPGYPYALDNLAQVELARGDTGRAIELAERAAAGVPLPQFVTTLGDLLARAGRREEARAQYALLDAIQKLLASNGVKTDLERALFDVDHGLRPGRTVALARAARADRPSILGDDVLSWALARGGRCAEARRWSQRALRLGTKDALMYFHRGWIERCLGNGPVARVWFERALRLNPDFSILWAPVARRGVA